ncbi:hypothetical protein GW17_00047855, partial [Ensete ventricosum]
VKKRRLGVVAKTEHERNEATPRDLGRAQPRQDSCPLYLIADASPPLAILRAADTDWK